MHDLDGSGALRKLTGWAGRAVTPILLLAVWQAASSLGAISDHTMVSPLQVARTFWALIADGELADNLLVSLRRVAIGLGIGVGIGTLCALVSGLSRTGEAAVDAPLQIMRAIPFLALVPLFILWFGIGETPKIALVALGATYPIYLNLYAGIRGVDKKLLEAGICFGLNRRQILRDVVTFSVTSLRTKAMASNIRTGYLFAASWVAMVGGFATTAHAAVTISTSPTLNVSCTSGVCTPTAANAVLNVGDLTTMLASGKVTVNTGSGSLAAQVEDIVVASTFNWASAKGLTLDAYRSVAVGAPVAVNGTAPVSLVTNDGGSGGNLLFISGGRLSFLGTTNKLSIDGQSYKLEPNIVKLAHAIENDRSGHYALSANYDAHGDGTYSKAPIASSSRPLTGTLNGLGNTISNLTIDETKRYQNVGLVAEVGVGGAVQSLGMANASIMANESNVGAIVGTNFGLLFGDIVTGSLALGGRLGDNLGGLVGVNAEGTIASCQASVSTTGPGGTAVGGLVGDNNGTISQSFAAGVVTAGNGNGSFVGGLVGYATGGVILNSYATGTATGGNDADIGGLVGVNANPNGGEATVSTSYSMGAPTGASGAVVGGLIGVDNFPGNQASDYWDTTNSGITNLSQGAGSPANDPGITGETTAQLQAALPAGFDPTIWAESPSINGGFPYLIANPPQ